MSKHARLLAAVSAALLLFTTPARAQFQVRWFQTFDGPAHDYDTAVATAVDGSGNVYVAAHSGTGSSEQGFLLKYTPDGALSWSRDLTGGPEGVTGLALDPANGDAVVVGVAPLSPTSDSDAIVARYAPDGTRRWFRRWDGPDSGSDQAYSVVVGSSGTAYVAALTQRSGASWVTDFAVLAFSETGTLAWESVLPATRSESAAAGPIVIDAVGNLIVTGYGGAIYPSDAVLIQLDPAGALSWYRTYDGPGSGFDSGADVACDAQRNVYVAGVVSMNDPSKSHVDYAGFLAKYDPQGNLVWDRIVNDPSLGIDTLNAVGIDYQGSVIVAGRRSERVGDFHAWLGKYDPQGDLLWERSWSDDDEHLESWAALDVDSGGGIAVAGAAFRVLDQPIYESDVEVQRFDKDGNLRWAHSGLYAVPNGDHATTVAFGPGGSVVYAGTTNASPGAETDVLVAVLREQAVPFCFGDGSAAACPCSNASAPGDQVGCTSSHGAGGKLVDSGSAALSDDTLTLTASSVPGSIAVFLQAGLALNAGQGAPFGDGVSCLGGLPFRLDAEPVVGGVASYPGPGDPSISVRGGVFQPGPRYYQAWFRDPAGFCTAATFNLTSGLAIEWIP